MPEEAVDVLSAAFVPLSVAAEVDAGAVTSGGAVTIEIGYGIALRVPGDVPAGRAVDLVRALRALA